MKTSQLGVAALVAAGLVASSFADAAQAADQSLSGTIASASGEKLGGVTVSAKAQGTTITTSVYTDDKGDYYFPPLPAGKYNVWAQALAFETAKGEVDLTAARRADLTLRPMTDAERRVRQLPGELLMAALPEAKTRTRASSGCSATPAPAAIHPATCCSSVSMKKAGTRSST